MKLVQFVNEQGMRSVHWLSMFLLLFCSTAVIANNTVVQFSMVQLEGTSLNDGYLIGRGRIICAGVHSGFRVWMAPQFLTDNSNSYVLNLVDNPQAKLHVTLKGEGWQPSMPAEPGIVKAGDESSAVFEIVANGDQRLSPGVYTLRLSAACT